MYAQLLGPGGFMGPVSEHPDAGETRFLQELCKTLRFMGALAMGLRDPAVEVAVLTDEKSQVHADDIAIQLVLPDVGGFVPLLAKEVVAQYIPELVGRGNIKGKRAAGAQGCVGRIEKRLDAVETLVNDVLTRNQLKEALKEIYDLERLSGRVACGNAKGKDLVSYTYRLS